jgi:hypothetical protein
MSRQLGKSKWFERDPAWEAMKASRRSLGPHEAATECAELTERYRRLWQPRVAGMIDLNTILQTLQAKKIPFVLTGAYGISSWTGRPRSTKDVDILVKGGRNYARAVKALRALYPALEVREFFGVMGFFPPGEKESVIDVTYPHRADIEETLLTAIWVEERGLRYRIPALETALANKYGAMVSLNRNPGKRLVDAADFFFMVQHAAEEGRPIDLARIADLGEKVWPGGGGAELLRLVEEATQGTAPNINQLHKLQP